MELGKAVEILREQQSRLSQILSIEPDSRKCVADKATIEALQSVIDYVCSVKESDIH